MEQNSNGNDHQEGNTDDGAFTAFYEYCFASSCSHNGSDNAVEAKDESRNERIVSDFRHSSIQSHGWRRLLLLSDLFPVRSILRFIFRWALCHQSSRAKFVSGGIIHTFHNYV